MEFKRMIVLANSIKKGERCVAGREVSTERNAAVGGWIRPISDESEGELKPRHMRVDDGSPLAVLDIVDVPLSEYVEDVVHPEDWVVDAGQKWKRRNQLHRQQLLALEEQPEDLWLESASHTDRVTGAFLSKRSSHQSLYLIRPSNLCIELSYEYNPFKNRNQKKTRARFGYRGQEYQMNLTDPVFTHQHCTTYPALGAQASIVRPPCRDNCLLCVSLTPEFNGFHYKVVATILELP